jgi:hypothetical protein
MNHRTDGDADDAAAASAAQAPAGNARRETIPPDAPVVDASTLSGATGRW